jgi:pyruvate kinase
MSPEDIILEGDGALWLKVLEIVEDGARCEVGVDGVIHPGRGIILQNETFSPRSLTEKDNSDLGAIAQSCGVFDAVAISFVSRAEEIRIVRDSLIKHGQDLFIVAKIETQLGIDNLDQIVSAADILMAARGDLALSRPWIELYDAVCAVATKARSSSKPWILATQITEGLERFAFPTRAEICDLAHWMMSGASGAMLSYETAFGPRPVDAVQCVRRIVDHYSANQLKSQPAFES